MKRHLLLVTLLVSVAGICLIWWWSSFPNDRESPAELTPSGPVVPAPSAGTGFGNAGVVGVGSRPTGETGGSSGRIEGGGEAPDPAARTGASTGVDGFDYPRQAEAVARLGEFEEIEAKVFRHPDGSIRVHRLLRTAMKYPLVRTEEVYSGESRTLVRQEIAVADHVLVQYPASMQRSEVEALAAGLGFSVRRWFLEPGMAVVEIPDPGLESLPEAIAALGKSPFVETAEPDHLVFTQ